MDKRGQVAIYVIIAIVIVAGILAVYFFYPNIKTVVVGETVPSTFLKSCIEQSVQSSVDILSKQGGYNEPEGFILYKGEKVKYLCYTSQYYKTCTVQQPLIKGHFEVELSKMIKDSADDCMQQLKTSYESQGYSVSLGGLKSHAEIVPGNIRLVIETPMSITKDSTQTFSELNIDMPSEMYNLLMISTSIIDYESTYGDSEVTLYMQYYPNLKIEKIKLEDGSKVYTLTDVTTKEKFVFASRSLAWPAGYGITS
ncbi:MAG: hypothetical protein Q7S74_00190 [Nanoarchaeota archaeon]|nr:hypothetical protein [Nanoarchaeota archaeon]